MNEHSHPVISYPLREACLPNCDSNSFLTCTESSGDTSLDRFEPPRGKGEAAPATMSLAHISHYVHASLSTRSLYDLIVIAYKRVLSPLDAVLRLFVRHSLRSLLSLNLPCGNGIHWRLHFSSTYTFLFRKGRVHDTPHPWSRL